MAFWGNDGMAHGRKAVGDTAAMDGMGSSATAEAKPAVDDFGCSAARGMERGSHRRRYAHYRSRAAAPN